MNDLVEHSALMSYVQLEDGRSPTKPNAPRMRAGLG